MALSIRLSRGGSKKRPYYRIVVADARSPRDGRFIEKIGTYNPLLAKDSDERVKLDGDRAKHWLSVGAQPTQEETGHALVQGFHVAYFFGALFLAAGAVILALTLKRSDVEQIDVEEPAQIAA